MIPKRFFDSTTRNYCIEHGVTLRCAGRECGNGERQLGAFKLPPFQRPAVWTADQKVRFIESIWLHLPIASYVVNVDDQHDKGYPCDDWLLDGQQRWTAILDYVEDQLWVFGLTWNELTKVQQRKFLNHPFPALETRNLTPSECRDVYERLAYGGTPHA